MLSQLKEIRAFVFDLDGTLYQDGRALPGAVESVQALLQRAYRLRYLTNTTSRSRSAVAEKLVRMGFAARESEIFSPPHAAGDYLRRQNKSAYLLVREGALPDFEGVEQDHQAPDAVVIGDLGEGWTFEKLNRAFRMILQGGAELIGLGRTRYWRTGGHLQLDAGPFIAALEYAADCRARIFGKPEAAFFERIVGDLDLPPEQIALVGDDIRTDVQAAMQAGLFGILVRSGKFRESDLEGSFQPDLVVESAAALAGHAFSEESNGPSQAS